MIWGSNKPKIKLKNVLINIWVIIILIIGSLPFVVNFGSEYFNVSADIITVNDDGGADYTKIQDAINAAKSGDTIYVWAGTYYENIIVNKSITLVGNGTELSIINGSNVGDVIYVTANWVNISGFTIKESGQKYFPSYKGGDAGIELFNVENVTINNNNCSNNDHGIFINNSKKNIIINNNCNFNNISGIKCLYSNFNVIKNNLCLFNEAIGIFFYWDCNSNSIEKNNCSKNSNGIFLEKSSFNIITNNNCTKNKFGFKFHYSYNNTLYNNYIYNNNISGFHLQYGSKDNYIYHNNFINNQENYYDDAWEEGYNYYNNSNQEGNYWSDYSGLDTGYITYGWDVTNKHLIAGDGIGDTLIPHVNLDYYPFTNQLGWLKPGTPILDDPGDVDSDGDYNLSWINTYRTTGYVLHEDNNSAFDSPTEIYNGYSIIFNISRKVNDTYYYRAKAYNEKYSGPWSNIENITVDWSPNIPKNLNVSTYPPGNILNLSWDLNLVDTQEYILEYKNETMADWQQINPILHPGFTYNHTGLVDGIRYDYHIQARDHRNQLSNFSKIISGIPWDSIPPAPPTGLIIVATTNNSISLNWNPNTEDDLEGYHLFRSKISNPSEWGNPIGTIPKGTEDYIDNGLDEKTIYYYVITAFDEVPNNSSFSNIAFGTTILGQHGPVINNPVDNFSIPEDTIDDSTIKLFEWFKDINNDTLEFNCEGQNNISVTIFQENGTVILIPKKDWNGQEKIIFYAKDTFDEVSDDVIITVTPVNDPPGPAIIIIPKENHTVKNGSAINFSAICNDPDIIYGDIITFNWESNLSNEIGIGDNLTNIILSPGNHTITLNVSDLVGETSIATVNITVLPEIKPNLNETPNVTEPEIPDNDTNQEKNKRDSSDSSIWIIIVIIIVMIIVIILFIILKKKKSQNIEVKKEDTQEVTKQQLPQINQPQSNNETITQDQDTTPLNKINQEQ